LDIVAEEPQIAVGYHLGGKKVTGQFGKRNRILDAQIFQGLF